MDRATVDEALCCAGRSLCCGCYNLRVIICARGRASSFFVGRRGASGAAARFFGGRVATGVAQQAAAVLYAATRTGLQPRARYLGQR